MCKLKNVCVVGYGGIGPVHAAAIEKTDSARLYAVCDTEAEKLKLCCSKYKVLEYTDFDEMLSDESIDSVHICTPHYLHFEMIKKALSVGKAVVCEKPVTMTKEEFEKLLELDNAKRVCVSFQNRFNPCVSELKRIADSGEMGKVISVRGVVTWCRTAEYYEHDAWRGKRAYEGGGVLINQAIHTLDLLCYVCGRVNSVKASVMNYSLPELEVEDTCSAMLNFERGVRGTFFATNAHGVNSPVDFELTFENGVLRYVDSKLYINGKLAAEDAKPQNGKPYWGNGHTALLKNYYDFDKYFNPYDVKNTMDAMFAIYESANTGGKEMLL